LNSRAACIGLTLLAMVCLGCLPEARVTWSPDGKWALVRGGDGLRLCDADGKLSLPIAENVPAAAWLPDSRQFIAVWTKSLVSWEELLPCLSEDRKAGAMAFAGDFRRQILAYKGDWGKFAFDAKPADIMAALMCLRDQFGKELAPVVGPTWEDLKGIGHTVYVVQLFEVADGEAKPGKRLLESLEPIAEVRVAPTGKAFAYAAPPYPPTSAEPTYSLFVASLAATDRPRLVQHRVAIFFDWTPDGRSLVLASADAPDPTSRMPGVGFGSTEQAFLYTRNRVREPERQYPLRAGDIIKREAVNEDGSLVQSPKGSNLAKVIFFDSLPVRCLRDGRVLFVTREVHLPAPLADMPGNLALFSVDPANPKAIRHAILPEVRKEVGHGLDLFQLSPDETRISAPDGRPAVIFHAAAHPDETRISAPDGKGAVVVLDLAKGQVTRTPDETVQGRTAMIPVWRSNEELCFVVPAGSKLGSPSREEVVLWSSAGLRCLSKDWPESVAKGFLQSK